MLLEERNYTYLWNSVQYFTSDVIYCFIVVELFFSHFVISDAKMVGFFILHKVLTMQQIIKQSIFSDIIFFFFLILLNSVHTYFCHNWFFVSIRMLVCVAFHFIFPPTLYNLGCKRGFWHSAVHSVLIGERGGFVTSDYLPFWLIPWLLPFNYLPFLWKIIQSNFPLITLRHY